MRRGGRMVGPLRGERGDIENEKGGRILERERYARQIEKEKRRNRWIE